MDRSYNGLFMSAFYPTCLCYRVVHPTKFNKAEKRQPFLPGQPRAWPSTLTLPRDVVAMSQQKESWRQLCHSQAGWAENWG